MKRRSIINEGQKKSPSARKIIKLRQRAFASGGASLELQIPTNYIRDVSRKLDYDITKIESENRLLWSEDFSNAYWSKDGFLAFIANATTSPTGDNSAQKLYCQTNTTIDYIRSYKNSLSLTASGFVTYSVHVKKAEIPFIHFRINPIDGSGAATGTNYGICYSLNNNTFSTGYYDSNIAAVTPTNYNSTFVGNGWYRISITVPSSVTSNALVLIHLSSNISNTSCVSALNQGVYVWGAQLEQSSITGTYQRTTSNPVSGGASLIMTPNTVGEGRLFNVKPELKNLLKYSEELDNASYWSKSEMTISADTTTAPNGTSTADKLIPSTNALTHYVNRELENVIFNTTHAVSFYAKSAGYNFVIFGSAAGNICFDLSSGIVSSNANSFPASITLDNNGFYKCSFTYTPTNETFFFSCSPTSSGVLYAGAGDGTSGVYLWGVQLEKGSTATAYQKTTHGISDFQATRATGATVTQKDGSTGDACYNLLQYSEEFDNSVWVKSNGNISTNALISPSGAMNADALLESATNTDHGFSNSSPVTIGMPYTFSIYFKYNGRQWIVLNIYDGNGNYAFFDILNGSIGLAFGGAIPKITPISNGWYRCSVTHTVTSSSVALGVASSIDGVSTVYNGDITKGFHVWGAQLTQGSQPKDYLKTTNRLNVPSIDYQAIKTNQLLWSEDYTNAIWSKSGVTVIQNATANHLGQNVASKIIETTGLVRFGINQGMTLTSGTTYTKTFYAKKAERNWCVFNDIDGVDQFVWFDLLNGVVGTKNGSLTASIVAQPNGWYKCTVSKIASTGSKFFSIAPALSDGSNNYTGDGTSGIYIWGAQLEQGSVATAYIPTTSTAASMVVPDANTPSLLVEPQRSNLILQSEDINNVSWIKGNSIAIPNSNINPFGANKSFYLNEQSSNNPHFLEQSSNITSGLPYTASFYVKKADDSWCQFAIGGIAFTVNVWANFNFDTGLFGNKGSTGVWSASRLNNGFWKISVTSNSVANGLNVSTNIVGLNNTDANVRGLSYVGTNRNFCDVSAIQFEQGSSPTSYIPTTTAAVTRNAYTSYVDLWNNNLLNKDNFTLYVEGISYNAQSDLVQVSLNDTTGLGGTGNYVGFYNGFNSITAVGGSVQGVGSGTIPNNSYIKCIIQRNGSTVKYYRNGVVIDTKTVTPFDYRYLTINNGGGTFSVQKIALWKHTKTDLECINLTTL